MTKITIEHIECIEDKLPMNYTLIALNDFYNDIDIDLQDDDIWTLYRCGNYYVLRDCGNDVISHVVLPPLPRNPTADDAELLHAYAAHGLTIYVKKADFEEVASSLVPPHKPIKNNMIKQKSSDLVPPYIRPELFHIEKQAEYISKPTITHAINKQGERVEVAICDTQ